jgi:hypothetical protein
MSNKGNFNLQLAEPIEALEEFAYANSSPASK